MIYFFEEYLDIASKFIYYISLYLYYLLKLLIANPIQHRDTNGLSLSPMIDAFLIKPEKPFVKLFILSGQILKR